MSNFGQDCIYIYKLDSRARAVFCTPQSSRVKRGRGQNWGEKAWRGWGRRGQSVQRECLCEWRVDRKKEVHNNKRGKMDNSLEGTCVAGVPSRKWVQEVRGAEEDNAESSTEDAFGVVQNSSMVVVPKNRNRKVENRNRKVEKSNNRKIEKSKNRKAEKSNSQKIEDSKNRKSKSRKGKKAKNRKSENRKNSEKSTWKIENRKIEKA